MRDSVGKNVKHYRKQKGLTQDQLAEALGITTQSLRQLENGMNLTSMNNFIKICQVLDIPSDFILAGVDKKFRIAAVAQKMQYLEELDDIDFESMAKSIEWLYYYKKNNEPRQND